MSIFNWFIPDVVQIPGPQLVAPLGKIDHVLAGLARLPQQWRDKQNIIDLLTIFLQRYNDLEQAYQDLLTLRGIDTANADAPSSTVGAQLDMIGAIVGQLRNGMTNDDYRRYIRARIAANNSDGVIEDLITVTSLVLNDPLVSILVHTVGVAACIVRITGDSVSNALAGILIDMLRSAHAAGVKLTLESWPDASDGNLFHFETFDVIEDPTAIGESGAGFNVAGQMLNFPVSGTITIDVGGNAENVDYYFPNGASGTDVNPVFRTLLTKNHASGTQLVLVGAVGKGFGDSTEGSTTTPYSNVGTTGGRFIDARE